MRLREAVFVALLAPAAMIVASCVDDDFADGQFLCSPSGGADECPEGMKCDASGRCRHPADPGDACVPRTCEQIAPACGALGNGCGGIVDCGCWPPLWCGGGGVIGQCGCLPEQTLERTAGDLYDDESNGGKPWIDPAKGAGSDDRYASVDLADAEKTSYLKAANFELDLPSAGIVIEGIEVIVERSADVEALISDLEVRVFVEGQLLPRVELDAAAWGVTDSEVVYGSATELWDSEAPLTAARLNRADFGVALVAQAAGGAAQARVDSIRVKVHFANPACPSDGGL